MDRYVGAGLGYGASAVAIRSTPVATIRFPAYQKDKTHVTFTPRVRALVAFLVLLLTLLFGAGCGPSYTVPDTPAAAITAADAKVKTAEEAEKSKSAQTDALWQEASGFYNAVANKFVPQAEGMKAAITAADITSTKLKNDYNAWVQLKQISRRVINSELPEKATLLSKMDELGKKMDEANSQGVAYKIMNGLVTMCGGNPEVSPVIAIFVIAIFVAVIMWPLQLKQYKSFKELAKYQPEIKKIQERYKEDPLLMQQKMGEFNKQHGINPMQGCVMIIPQMLIFFAMFQLIQSYQFHFTEAHFLWINPAIGKLSLTWPYPLTGALAHHLGELDILLLLLYAFSQFLQSKLLPPPTDPTQAEVQKAMTTFMPVTYFLFMLQSQVSSAFVLYYFISTLLGMLRQWMMNRMNKDDGASPVLLAAESASGDNAKSGGAMTANTKLISPKNQKKK
jgi:YidC/Oxa1 family membrane protein insertase